MTDPSAGDASEAHEDLSYLARSPNRVAVLAALDDGPATRAELLDRLGISRMTLDRTVEAFTERDWVRTAGVRYAATPTGALVAAAYDDLVETLTFAREYGDVLRWLPTDDMSFDLRVLADAHVTRADRTDPLAVMRRVTEQTLDASRVRAASHAIDPGFVQQLHDGVRAGRIDAEAVVTADVYETFVTDAEYADLLVGLLDAGAGVYRYDGDIPHLLSTFDDAVGIGVENAAGTPLAIVHSKHPDVLAWASDTFERYRADATQLTAADVRSAAAGRSADVGSAAGRSADDGSAASRSADDGSADAAADSTANR